MIRSSEQRLEALASLLDLDEEFEVAEAHEDRGCKLRRFVIVPRQCIAVCPHCGKEVQERHACHDREVLDLPLGAYATRLVVRLFQFRCDSCDKFFTPHYAALAQGAHATERFLQRMAELVKHSDVRSTAAYLGVAEKTLSDWYYQYVARLQRQQKLGHEHEQLKPIHSLGIDELSLKKDISSSASC